MITLGIFLRITALLLNLALGVIAYRRNPQSVTNKLLALLAITILCWGIANEFSINASTPEDTLFWIRMVMFFAVPLTVFFFLLMYTFPRVSFSIPKNRMIVVAVLTVFSMATAHSPYLFTHIKEGVGLDAKPVPGLGIIIFLATAILAIVLGLYALIRKNFTLKGVERLQARYLLLGTSMMFFLILSFIFFPVIFFDNSSFVPYSSLYVLPFIIATTYAIVRHRLMDIRAAIFKSLSFSALIGFVLLIYGLFIFTAVPIISSLINVPAEYLAAIAALVSIPVAKYIQKILSRVTDRFLFQKRINYRAELVKASRGLSGTINIRDVTLTIIMTTENIIRARKTTIFLKKSDSEVFSPIASHGVKNIKVTIPADHHLIEHIKKSQKLIIKDELAFETEQTTLEKRAEELKRVEESLTWLDATVVLPLFVNKKLSGIIVLGNKKSGDPYLQDDIEFLSSFAPQAATALQNAQLYQESLEFGKKLEVEVKRATSELAVANEQLRDLDKAKSEFLSIASHQLYTPLTAIRGYLSMLNEKDYGELTEKQKPIIQILEKSSNKLIALIKNLLDISRIESGRLELNLESADLVEVVSELIMELKPNAITKQLGFKFVKSKKPLPQVVVDRQRIRQVLLNFIDNAIKYTAKGKVEVTVNQEGQELVFAVTDTGEGLTREGIAKLFNKFTRVGGDARFKTEGTGLGLYVAKQIVKEHRGEVDVSSPGLGEGSMFAIRLPIEGSPNSLKLGDKVSVDIKAAESGEDKG
jgi:signal transduction histidine kinase